MITLFVCAHFFDFVSFLLYPTEVKRLKCAMLQTVKTQMKCRVMWHFIRLYTVKVKKNFRQNKAVCFYYYKLTPLAIYNGSFQLNFVEPEGRAH